MSESITPAEPSSLPDHSAIIPASQRKWEKSRLVDLDEVQLDQEKIDHVRRPQNPQLTLGSLSSHLAIPPHSTPPFPRSFL